MSDGPSRSLLPVVIGMAITIVFLTALGYLANLRRNARTVPPELTIIAPIGQPADSPFTIVFRSAAPLELTRNGWAAGPWHLHARVNGTEYMPAASELTAQAGAYHWTLPAVGRGDVAYHLGWADQAHREIATSRTATVETTVR